MACPYDNTSASFTVAEHVFTLYMCTLKPGPKVTMKAMVPLRKKIRTCFTEVDEIQDEDSTCNIAVWNGSNSSISSFQILTSKKVCCVLSHIISS
jgi:hypothetical protein